MQQLVEAEDYHIGTFSRYSPVVAYEQDYYRHRRDKETKGEVPKQSEKEKAIENLENLVQDYIDWAKSEGRY